MSTHLFPGVENLQVLYITTQQWI